MSKPNVHGLPQHLRKDEAGYFLDYFVQDGGVKKRKRERLGLIPLAQARKILAQHTLTMAEQKYLGDSRPKITFTEAADGFLNYSRSRKKSFKQDGFYVNNLKRFFGDKPLESLNLDMVEMYLNWRKTEGNKHYKPLTNTSLNRDLACLKTLVRRALLNRQIDRNPVEGLKLYKETSRSRTLTQEEYQRLLDCCPPHFRPIVLLAYYTGMRKGEIFGLTWERVDFHNGVIILEAEDTKTQEKREIPLDESLKEILKRVPRTVGCPYVFNHRGNKLSQARTGFRNACLKSGLDDFHFHDLRHCAITNMRKAGVPDTVIMSISGHKTNAVFRRYDKIDRTDRLGALEKVRVFNDTRMTPQATVVKSFVG